MTRARALDDDGCCYAPGSEYPVDEPKGRLMPGFRLDECVYCGDPPAHNEHVRPRSRGGRLTLPSCGPCNLSKGRRTPEEWFHAQSKKGDFTPDAWRRLMAMDSRLPLLIEIGVFDPVELLRLIDVEIFDCGERLESLRMMASDAMEMAAGTYEPTR